MVFDWELQTVPEMQYTTIMTTPIDEQTMRSYIARRDQRRADEPEQGDAVTGDHDRRRAGRGGPEEGRGRGRHGDHAETPIPGMVFGYFKDSKAT